MRKLLLFSFALLLLACSKDDDASFVKPIAHNFQVTYGEAYNDVVAANARVDLENNEDGRTYSATTNDKGVAQLEIVPGVYNVTVSRTFTAEEYQANFGQQTATEVVFNASMENLTINAQSTLSTDLELVTGRIGNLLIKQIYYAGSHVRQGASFRDQFFEIHNNSNEVIYLDGLYFAQVFGETSISSSLDPYNLPNGQYDWSQSIGQADPENANSDYIYADEVLQFPGNGEDYPLEPGSSTIVAATAVNHKAPLTVTDDEGETVVYEVPEPDLTIDLSNAQFEAYFRPFQESSGSSWLDSDIDNPNAANMEIAFKSFGGKDLILDPLGRDAYVIFSASEEEFNTWNAVPSPAIEAEEFDETTNDYLQIPISFVIDGVETQRTDASKAKPKRLPDVIDAGEISTIQGFYTSEAVIRKVSAQVDGKVYYQDTNNSKNDFIVLARPEVNIQ